MGVLSSARWAQANLLSLCALVFFFYATVSAAENPYDSADVSGLPAVSIYLVLLIVLTVFSVVLWLAGFIIQKTLGKKNGLWRRLGFLMALLPVSTVSLLGFIVSVAYNNYGWLSWISIALYNSSVMLVVLSFFWSGSHVSD